MGNSIGFVSNTDVGARVVFGMFFSGDIGDRNIHTILYYSKFTNYGAIANIFTRSQQVPGLNGLDGFVRCISWSTSGSIVSDAQLRFGGVEVAENRCGWGYSPLLTSPLRA